jgi:CPA2 family monovalent cation:H+ antiporter-2
VGFESGLLSPENYQLFLDVTVLTMAATSLIMAASPHVADGMLRLPLPKKLKARAGPSIPKTTPSLRDHLIIVGYGVNGRNVAASAKIDNIPYLIIETDPEIVSIEGKQGEPIYFGDAAQESVLRHMGIEDARVLVIAISDPLSTRRITELGRRLNSSIFIIARTRYIQEMKPLHDLGADDVVPEEYETSIEIFSRVLDRYQVPRNKIEMFIDQIRSDGYDMFRSRSKEPYCTASLSLTAEEIGTLRVWTNSPAAGRSLSELELEGLGIRLLAVHRGGDTLNNPEADLVLYAEDIVILMGPEESIHKIAGLFSSN